MATDTPKIKIIGYRELSEQEIALMNEGKALAEQVGKWVNKLRAYPDVGHAHPNDAAPPLELDQRWIAMGKTDLQRGFMMATRGISKPTSF